MKAFEKTKKILSGWNVRVSRLRSQAEDKFGPSRLTTKIDLPVLGSSATKIIIERLAAQSNCN